MKNTGDSDTPTRTSTTSTGAQMGKELFAKLAGTAGDVEENIARLMKDERVTEPQRKRMLKLLTQFKKLKARFEDKDDG